MAKKKTSKKIDTKKLILLGGAGAALFFLMNSTKTLSKDEAVKIIVDKLQISDPAKLQMVKNFDTNYLVMWATAIKSGSGTFVSSGNMFDTNTGKKVGIV